MTEEFFLAHRNALFRHIPTGAVINRPHYDSINQAICHRFNDGTWSTCLPLDEFELVLDNSSAPPQVSSSTISSAIDVARKFREQEFGTSPTGGVKEQKEARFDLIPAAPLHALATLYGRGAKKYEDRNWEKGFNWSWSLAALKRHLNLFEGGEDFDLETGVLHLINVAWHAFALAEFYCRETGTDDRPYRNAPVRSLVQEQSELGI